MSWRWISFTMNYLFNIGELSLSLQICRLIKLNQLILIWVSGHLGIEENWKADMRAKEAGLSSTWDQKQSGEFQ